ncbi:MAG: DUF3135 domain-containing protein [Methylococcales bacterium]|mgnify:CR=1 FL=1|jgi:hypothetical protein|nr:DUF3135 domain-containing protein [Methylococcales bacterium]MBT7445654.1 DUF3135 domain-containing protein [Methylococcales bacterium]
MSDINIDFDTWSKLAKEDPEAFEARRKEVIQQLIDSAPEDQRHRLECLQWKVDQIRSRSKTPLAACLRMSKMMWDRVLGKSGLMESLDQLSLYSKAYPNKPVLNEPVAEKAPVLMLNARQHNAEKEQMVR